MSPYEFLIIWLHLFRNANSMSVLCIYRVSQHMMLRGRSLVRDWPKSFASFTRLRRSCIMNTFSWLRMGAKNMRHWVWCNLRSAHSVCCELVFCLWKGSKTQKTSSVSFGSKLRQGLANPSGHGWRIFVFLMLCKHDFERYFMTTILRVYT